MKEDTEKSHIVGDPLIVSAEGEATISLGMNNKTETIIGAAKGQGTVMGWGATAKGPSWKWIIPKED